MADPLRLLQEYVLQQLRPDQPGIKPIQLRQLTHNNEKYIAFNENAYPAETQTQLLVYNTQNEKVYYSLEAILFFWENSTPAHNVYVKEASAKGLRPVTRPDRREILDFIEGRRQELPTNSDPHNPPRAPIPLSRILVESSEPASKRPRLDGDRNRADIDALLNKENQNDVDASQYRSLNDNLTADKIAALKKKKLNNQKKNVISNIEDDLDMDTTHPNDIADEEFKQRERTWKTRANCMEAVSKDFSGVLELLKVMKTRDEVAAKAAQAPAPVSKNQQRPKQQQGYSRYDQEVFSKDANLGIDFDKDLTFVGTNLKAFAETGKVEKVPLAAPSTSRPPPVITRPVVEKEPPAPKRRTNKTPIIIIPSGVASLITMFNVKDILGEMKFVTTDAKKAQGARKESETQVHRKRKDVTVPYRIVENAMRLSEEEWDRVVAVFVMGPSWQFKGWKWNGNPVEIFSHIAAFHIHYDDMKVVGDVSKWNVTLLPVSREKRHLDRARLVKFWDVLDRYIVKNKSHLRY